MAECHRNVSLSELRACSTTFRAAAARTSRHVTSMSSPTSFAWVNWANYIVEPISRWARRLPSVKSAFSALPIALQLFGTTAAGLPHEQILRHALHSPFLLVNRPNSNPLLQGWELCDHCRADEPRQLTLMEKTIIWAGIAYGMKGLHAVDAIHQNLKESNVLLESRSRD
jgi:hypothetical protein